MKAVQLLCHLLERIFSIWSWWDAKATPHGLLLSEGPAGWAFLGGGPAFNPNPPPSLPFPSCTCRDPTPLPSRWAPPLSPRPGGSQVFRPSTR